MARDTGNAGVFDTVLNGVRKVIVGYNNTVGQGMSLSDVNKIGRVEPPTIVSRDLVALGDTLWNIMQGLTDIYTAQYLQAVDILSTQLVDTRILKILDSVNPDRDMKTLLSSVSIESSLDRFVIPANDDNLDVVNRRRYFAMEGLEYGINSRFSNEIVKKRLSRSRDFLSMESSFYQTGDYDSDLNEFTDLEENDGDYSKTGVAHSAYLDRWEKMEGAVGKVVEISFRVGEMREPVSLKAVIQLDTSLVHSSVVRSILALNGEGIRFTDRWKQMTSGRIEFWRDFVLARDLVETQKKTLMKDGTQAYDKLLAKTYNSKMYGSLTGNTSYNSISGIMVISEEDENSVKPIYGGSLDDKKVKEKIFDATGVMIIAVVERGYERVRVYTRNIDKTAIIPFRNFSKPGKNDEIIMELFKGMNKGIAPSF